MSTFQDPIKEFDVGSYEELSARPNPNNFTLQYVPALVALLLAVERKKGVPLTKEETESVRNKASIMAVSSEAARSVEVRRGYIDIEPRNVWQEWQEVRTQFH